MDIKAAVEEASKELLPEKSREIYEKQEVYIIFL